MIFIFMDNILIAGQLRYLVSWKISTWQWWMKTRLITSFVKRPNLILSFMYLKDYAYIIMMLEMRAPTTCFYIKTMNTLGKLTFSIYDEVIILRSFRCNLFQSFLKIWRKVNWCQKKVILYLRQTNWLNMERH